MANSDNLGPHDGSLDGERFLDELLLHPGRAIVLSAGNFNRAADPDGEGPAWHALALPADRPQLPLILKYGDGAAANDAAEVWFRPPEGVAPAATIAIKMRNVSIERPVTVTERNSPLTILRPQQNPNDRTTVVAQLQRDGEADAYCLRLVFPPGPVQGDCAIGMEHQPYGRGSRAWLAGPQQW